MAKALLDNGESIMLCLDFRVILVDDFERNCNEILITVGLKNDSSFTVSTVKTVPGGKITRSHSFSGNDDQTAYYC